MTLLKICRECKEPIQHSGIGPSLKIWCACDVRLKEHMDAGGAPLPKKWLPPIVQLSCGCCGGYTLGRQWWNQDDGYGVCAPCVEWMLGRGEPRASIEDWYGKEGINWGVK